MKCHDRTVFYQCWSLSCILMFFPSQRHTPTNFQLSSTGSHAHIHTHTHTPTHTNKVRDEETLNTFLPVLTESGLSVAMVTTNGSKLEEGDRLQLICKVTGFKGRLSVSWQHRSATTDRFTDVITLSQEGVMETGVEFGQRVVSALRPTPSDFTLQLSGVTPGDAGLYQCTVSEWTTETDGNAKKTHSQSQQCTVSVTAIGKTIVTRLEIQTDGFISCVEGVVLMSPPSIHPR